MYNKIWKERKKITQFNHTSLSWLKQKKTVYRKTAQIFFLALYLSSLRLSYIFVHLIFVFICIRLLLLLIILFFFHFRHCWFWLLLCCVFLSNAVQKRSVFLIFIAAPCAPIHEKHEKSRFFPPHVIFFLYFHYFFWYEIITFNRNNNKIIIITDVFMYGLCHSHKYQ